MTQAKPPWLQFHHVAPPLPIAGAGHFLQEDAGVLIAEHIRHWLGETAL
jgi:hypothetical protein